MWRELYSRTRTFGAELHKSKMRVKRWHNKYKILNYIERHNFCLNDLLTKSNCTASQTYRVEERTFGTPCILCLCSRTTIFFALNSSERRRLTLTPALHGTKPLLSTLCPLSPPPPPPKKNKLYKLCSSLIVDFTYFTYFLLLAMF